MTIPTITPLPSAPTRGDSESTFTAAANKFVAALPTMVTEANLSIAGINSGITTCESAIALSDTYLGLASFEGAWSNQAGAATIPYSVANSGSIWVLLSNLADVTKSEPTASNTNWMNVTTAQMYAVSGSASTPSVSFSSDTNTGIYLKASDDLGITVGGTLRVNITTNTVTSTLQILAPAGTVSNPGHSFSTDTNSGLFSVGSDNVSLSVGGTNVLDVAAGVVKITGQAYTVESDHGTVGTTETLDFSVSNIHYLTLDENVTLTFSNPKGGGIYTIILQQDTNGGNSVTWPTNVVWPAATAPTITTNASKTDLVCLTYSAKNSNYLGSFAQNYTIV